jgi:hypothetical protein
MPNNGSHTYRLIAEPASGVDLEAAAKSAYHLAELTGLPVRVFFNGNLYDVRLRAELVPAGISNDDIIKKLEGARPDAR